MPIGQLGMMGIEAAAGSVLGLVNDRRQYNQNKRNQELQIKGQKELTDYNSKKQLEMWEATGYGAQKAQMMKAGINPALMYGMSGGGGQSSGISAGSVASGAGTSSGGEAVATMGMGLNRQLLQAQKDNIEASTEKMKVEAAKTAGADTVKTEQEARTGAAQENVLKTTNELQKLDKTVNEQTLWERINGIIGEAIAKEEAGIQAGVQTKIQEDTIDANIARVKAEAINAGLQGAAIKAGIQLTEEQTRKVGQDILQKWAEISQGGTKNEWEHSDRLKAIEEYTANALKVAGIMAVGNLVRDVAGIATRRPLQKAPTNTRTVTQSEKGGYKETYTEKW